MSFLKSMLKINSRHKKLNEELALASSLKDFADSPLDLNDEDDLSDDIVTYNLKYLGSTTLIKSIDETKSKIKLSSKKSSLATTSAIKKIVVASKNQKKLSEVVTISISAKGIEAFDIATDERVIEIPIYKISYCSVDAAHDTIFSFVSSSVDGKDENNFQNNQFGSPDSPAGQLESTSIDDEGDLVLHAFQCNKRKIAHKVTMSVARAFEKAFNIYQNEQLLKETQDDKKSTNKENIHEAEKNVNSKCLIDLDEAPQLNHLYSKESNQYLQTTWVSFD